MINCFGDKEMCIGEKQIYRMAKKDRRKYIFKEKSEERGNNYRLQKAHISYRYDLSEISNEV
jgi:lipase chaperone LimK